jgi:hypothetical protein
MRKALFSLIQICLLNGAAFTAVYAQQTCTVTNLRLQTQAAVNSFNSACTTIKGDMSIAGADITDLSPLANIELFDGILTIQNNTSLTTLEGLDNLANAKTLLILSNNLLTDLSGLEALTSVSGTLRIGSNNNLVSLDGLDSLTTAGSVYVSSNNLLANLSGLGGLESVSDIISINDNNSLASLNGLTSLTSVARILIGGNPVLPDLSGLEALRSVSWQMNVSSNPSMVSFDGLDNISSLSELYLGNNNLMTDLSGLEVLSHLEWLVVGEFPALTSLNGLNNLLSVTHLIIRNNPLLTDLSGLESITSIGSFLVTGNAVLPSLEGLGGATSGDRKGANERVAALEIQSLTITSNPQLTTCAIAAVCDFIRTGTATISGNGSGCESQAAVEIACGSLPVKLAHFTASAENKAALLQWETTQESNSYLFEIEHSLDAGTWQKAGEHAARGESTAPVNYQWIHTSPASELNYYRLKMIDLDGSFAYSRIASVKFDDLDPASALIYPNPVSDILSVENKNGDIILLKIIDLQGKTVYETTKVSKEGLSVKRLSKGLYQIHVMKRGGEVQAERLVIF